MRLHLPSPDEIRTSNQLIERLEKEKKALVDEVETITQRETRELQEYESRMFLARQEIQQELEKLEEEYGKVVFLFKSTSFSIESAISKERTRKCELMNNATQPLKSQQSVLEELVLLERAFLSPIKRLPVELFSEIFTYCVLGNGIKRSTLCQVCRSWRSIVYRTPRVWCTIDLSEWGHLAVEKFKARLELSGNLPLDVTLRRSNRGGRNLHEENVHRELAKAGIKRWRSLRIDIQPFESNDRFLGIYSGKFTSLSELYVEGRPKPRHPTSFEDVLALIADSAPPLKVLQVYGANYLPYFTADTPAVRSLSSMVCKLSLLCGLAPYTLSRSLTRIQALGGNIDDEFEMTFEKVVDATLASCSLAFAANFPNVVCLDLKDIYLEVTPNLVVTFSQLRVLDIKAKNVSILKSLSTPRLENLSISQTHHNYDRPDISKSALDVFENTSLSMAPTTLYFDVNVSRMTIISILTAWPQLQNATFHLEGEFRTASKFVGALTKVAGKGKIPKICPGLLTLSFIGCDYCKGKAKNRWEKDSKKLLASRAALKSVECTWARSSGSCIFERDDAS